MSSDPIAASARLNNAIKSLESLTWQRDMMDESGRWFYAYGAPPEAIALLESRGGRFISGDWCYYLPRTATGILKGTVRKISFDDWQLTPKTKRTQARLGP